LDYDAARAAARLRAAAANVKIPKTMLASFHEAPPDPVAGQVWRAAWDDVVEVVAIRAADGSDVDVIPMSFETGYADSDAHVVPAEATSLGVALAAWTGLERRLPTRVLHRCLGMVSGDMEPSWPESLPGVARGRRIVTPIDPRAEHRAELEDHLDSLSEADWAPAGTGLLAHWLRDAKFSIEELAKATNCAPPHLLALRRGLAPATEEEAECLAPMLGRPVADILAANPPVPEALRARLDRPAWRACVQRLARLRNLPERLAWQGTAYGAMRLAPRETAGDEADVWDKRLERYFQATLES
jgi:hypothetical protein